MHQSERAFRAHATGARRKSSGGQGLPGIVLQRSRPRRGGERRFERPSRQKFSKSTLSSLRFSPGPFYIVLERSNVEEGTSDNRESRSRSRRSAIGNRSGGIAYAIWVYGENPRSVSVRSASGRISGHRRWHRAQATTQRNIHIRDPNQCQSILMHDECDHGDRTGDTAYDRP